MLICDVCDEAAGPGRPLVRVYTMSWEPVYAHEACWSDEDADCFDAYRAARAALDSVRRSP